MVLFYLIRNFIVGNLDLPGDLFSQGVLFAGTVLGAGERRLRTYPVSQGCFHSYFELEKKSLWPGAEV